MIKQLLKYPFIFIIKLVYKNLDYKRFAIKTLLLCVLRQKIFGTNRKASWPVHHSSKIVSPEKIIPGTWAPGLSINCYLDGRNGIIFEENVRFGPGAAVISMNHDNFNYSKYRMTRPIKIGKNSWLAAHCIILPGVELGEHTIVAAGAVVTKSFPTGNQIIAGNPAKVVKQLAPYNEKEEREYLNKL